MEQQKQQGDLSGALGGQKALSSHSSSGGDAVVRGFALARHAKAFGFALAVDAGKFQFQTVTYDKKGVSTCKAESPWLNLDDAEQFIYSQESDQ